MANSRDIYISPEIGRAMNQQMERMPAHLKQYASGQAGYVPPRVEHEMAKQLQKNAPGHLKQYADAYVHERVVEPGFSQEPRTPGPHPPAVDMLRLDHSISGAGQYAVDPTTMPKSRTGFQQSTPEAAAFPGQPEASTPEQPANPYEFITSAGGNPPKKPLLPGGGSKAQRLLVVAGGAFVLVIIAVIAINTILGSGNNTAGMISIAAQQNELVRVAGIGMQQAQATTTQNFAVTTDSSITSAQQQLLAYLQQHGTKVNPKQLTLTESAATNTQLNNAISTSSFDSAFTPIMQNDLKNYEVTLKQQYIQTKSTSERQLLSNDYDDALLLLDQLNSPDS